MQSRCICSDSADETIEFTTAGAERLKAWLEVAFIMSVQGAATPPFNKVEVWDGGPPAKQLIYLLELKSNRALYKGLNKLAVARGFDDESDAPAKYMKLRYEHLRLTVSGA